MEWGHYGIAVEHFNFIYAMIAWNLLALDLQQQLKRYDRKKKAREQWGKS